MAPLLIHDDRVPRRAREALRAAFDGDPEDRERGLERAARILRDETSLDCGDVRELVGLDPDGECQ